MAFTILSTVNGYYRAEESLTVPDSAGANVTTANSSNLDVDVANTKFGVQITVTETSAGDGALDARLQGSVDGTNFVTVDTSASIDVDPTGANTGVGILDASGLYFPYWRIQVFSDGTDTVDASTVALSFAAREIDVIRTA